MDSRFYDLKLTNHKMFKDLKGCLGENVNGKLSNLFELKDDMLYVWNCVENCLFCLNLKHLEDHGDDTPYQKLHLLSPPSFAVERVVSSGCGGRLLVWGARGVTVAELPARWGLGGLFDSGSQTVLCKSVPLDERFLYSQGDIRSVQWHPTSLSHVLVLISDNTIRLYKIGLKTGPKLVRSFTVGPRPSSLVSGRAYLDSLGDTAVDFTAVPSAESLLILRGNGDVYMLPYELDGKSPGQHKVLGPLAMFPPADDNYGTESCCIVALQPRAAPPLVLVATAPGALYHCVLLPDSSECAESTEARHALYVLEAVELDGVLHDACPMRLYACGPHTYACVHAGGVHSVTLPQLDSLLDYAMAEDAAEAESALCALRSRRGAARRLLCTRVPVSGATQESAHCAPRGVAVLPPPLPQLLLLCTDDSLVLRTLEPYDLEEQLYKEMQLKNPELEQDDIYTILKEKNELSFTSIVQEILMRDGSQPILNIGNKDEPSAKESLEMVTMAISCLREEYISRQRRALEAISLKLQGIQNLAVHHQDWLKELQEEVDEVQGVTSELTKKCNLAEKKQEDLKYRCSAVIRRLRARQAHSPAERHALHELNEHARRAHTLADHTRHLRTHALHKSAELEKWKEDYKKKDIALGKSHSDTIFSILQQQTSQVSTLIEETKQLKDQLNIV